MASVVELVGGAAASEATEVGTSSSGTTTSSTPISVKVAAKGGNNTKARSPRYNRHHSIYREQLRISPPNADVVLSLQQLQKLKYLFRLRRFLEDWIFFLGMFGLLLVIAELEVLQQSFSWDMNGSAAGEPQPKTRAKGSRMKWSRTVPATVILKVFLTLSTLLLVSLQLARYVTMVKIDVLRNVVPPSSRLWNSWKVLLTFFIEVALCIIHVPPMWNDYKAFTPEGSDNYYIPLGYVHETKLLPSDAGYDPEDIAYFPLHYHIDTLNALVIVRIYLFTYWVRNHSGYFSQHASFVGSLHSVDTMSAWFNLKMLFHVRPVSLLVPTTILTTLLTAFAMLVFERPVQHIVGSGIIDWATSVWCTVVTLSTVGYGDISPKTTGGQLASILGGIIGGTAIIALITAFMIDRLTLNREEKTVITLLDYEKWKRSVSNWAAVLVQNGWLQSQVVRSKREGLPMPPSGRSYKSHVARLFKAMNRLRTLRRSEPEEVLDSSKIFSRIDARLRNMTELVHTKFDESSARMDKLVHANALLCRQNEALFELTARLEERVKATEGKKLS